MTNNEQLICADKLVFDTESAARAEATAIRYRRGIKLKVYKCQHCQLWHLSSNSEN